MSHLVIAHAFQEEIVYDPAHGIVLLQKKLLCVHIVSVQGNRALITLKSRPSFGDQQDH
jgi:hypothetical protein